MATKTKKKKPTKEQLLAIWQEAQPIKGKDPKVWRKDDQGTVIKFADYEGTSKFSWQIQ